MLLKSIRRMYGLHFEGQWRWAHHFLLVIWLSMLAATPPRVLGYFLGDTKAVLNGCKDHWTLQDRGAMPLLFQMTVCVDIRVVAPGPWIAFSYSSVHAPRPELGLEGDDGALYGWLLRVRHRFPLRLSPTHWHRVCLRRDVPGNSFSLEVDGKMVAERTVIAQAIPPSGSLWLGCRPRDRPQGGVLGEVEVYLFRMWADLGDHGLCEDGTVIGWNAQFWGLTSPNARQRDPNLLCDHRRLKRGAGQGMISAPATGTGKQHSPLLGSSLENCDISKLCSNESAYFLMSVSVEAKGGTEQAVRNLVSKAFVCDKDRANATQADFCQGKKQSHIIQVNCREKQQISKTNCSVLLWLTHAVSACELQHTRISALRGAGDNHINATIIGVERVGLDVCEDVKPSSGVFVKCTSSWDDICKANWYSKLKCSLIEPNPIPTPQPKTEHCGREASRFCNCTAFCNSPRQFFAMEINIISTAVTVSLLQQLFKTNFNPNRLCNIETGSQCQEDSEILQHYMDIHLECHGTQQRLYSCMVILEVSGPVNACSLSELLQQLIDSDSGITNKRPLARMAVCGAPGLPVHTLLASNLTWVDSNLLTSDICQPDPTLLKCEANESLAVLLNDSCPPRALTTNPSTKHPSPQTKSNLTTSTEATPPTATKTTQQTDTTAENTPATQQKNASQGTTQPNITTPLSVFNSTQNNTQSTTAQPVFQTSSQNKTVTVSDTPQNTTSFNNSTLMTPTENTKLQNTNKAQQNISESITLSSVSSTLPNTITSANNLTLQDTTTMRNNSTLNTTTPSPNHTTLYNVTTADTFTHSPNNTTLYNATTANTFTLSPNDTRVYNITTAASFTPTPNVTMVYNVTAVETFTPSSNPTTEHNLTTPNTFTLTPNHTTVYNMTASPNHTTMYNVTTAINNGKLHSSANSTSDPMVSTFTSPNHTNEYNATTASNNHTTVDNKTTAISNRNLQNSTSNATISAFTTSPNYTTVNHKTTTENITTTSISQHKTTSDNVTTRGTQQTTTVPYKNMTTTARQVNETLNNATTSTKNSTVDNMTSVDDNTPKTTAAPLNNQTTTYTTVSVAHNSTTTNRNDTISTTAASGFGPVSNLNTTAGTSFNLSSTAGSLTTDFNITKGPRVNLTTAANTALEHISTTLTSTMTTTATTAHSPLPAQDDTTTAMVSLPSTTSTTTLQTTTLTSTTNTIAGTGITSTTTEETTNNQAAQDEQADALLSETQDATRLNSSEVTRLVGKLEKLLDGPTVSQTVGSKTINIVSNLMQGDSQALSASANRLIRLVDILGLKLAVTDDRAIISSNLLVLAVKTVDGTNFPATSVNIFNTNNVQLRGLSRSQSESSEPAMGSVFLPSSLTDGLSPEEQQQANRVQFTYYTKSTFFQDAALKNQTLVGPVLGSSVANMSISNLKENIQFTIRNANPIPANFGASCVFWDFDLNGGGGGWSSAGCSLVKATQEDTTCSCNHLTSFAILLDLSRQGITDRQQAQILTFITYIGCGISAVFLAVTILTYVSFEKLLRDIPAKILVQLCMSFLLLNLVYLLDGWLALYPATGLCICTAFFLHYFLLTSFTWAGLEALHMYLSIIRVFTPYLSRYMLKFTLMGWGIPLIVVIIVISVDKDNYGLVTYGRYTDGTSDDFCWLKNDIAFYVGVVAYFILIFGLCLLIFIIVMVQLARIKRQNPQNQSPNRGVMTDLRSIAGLIILLGLTWGFALFAWGPLYLPFVYLFSIFNSLQGFFIFVFHCAIKESVRRQWRTYLCCGNLRLPENSEWSRTATQNNKSLSVTTATTSAPHLTSRSSSVISNSTNSSGSVFADSGISDSSNSDVVLNELHRRNLSLQAEA